MAACKQLGQTPV